ncbi:ComEA family DNA-binding protein [Methylomarinum vadi]|uniref:ComEA family DNA-binding protein n=1 Tax=Methylomarinum vadi TaxID=438855 RepID=UPI000564B444|nr:helix-hairpin-helix domain-containing protein [Methylomarinum vadi]
MNASQPQANSHGSSDVALIGNCGYRIQNNRVIIDIAQIANQRDMDNLSGTLSIELWALKQPYAGLGFNGIAVAGTTIGEIAGQHFLANCRYDLVYQEPPEGTWFLTLMLREWTGTGYATRDFVNFALPYVVVAKPAITRSETDNVINVRFAEKKPLPVSEEKAQSQPVESKADKTNPKKSESANTALSLNTASYQDIAAIKGVSKKLAEHIIRKRPFESFDELKKIKGIGPKLLQKISHLFTL